MRTKLDVGSEIISTWVRTKLGYLRYFYISKNITSTHFCLFLKSSKDVRVFLRKILLIKIRKLLLTILMFQLTTVPFSAI